MRIKRLNQKKKEIAGLIYFFALSACNPMKKEKEQKKKKESIGVKRNFTTIHMSPKKEEDIETHQMMWRKLGFNHYL